MDRTGTHKSPPKSPLTTSTSDKTSDQVHQSEQKTETEVITSAQEVFARRAINDNSTSENLFTRSQIQGPNFQNLATISSEMGISLQTGGIPTVGGIDDLTSGLNPTIRADIAKTLGLLSRPKSNPEDLLALLSNQVCWQKSQLGCHRLNLQAAYKQQFQALHPAQKQSILSRLGSRQVAALKQELKTVDINTKDITMSTAEKKKLASLLSELQTDLYSAANERFTDSAYRTPDRATDQRSIVFHEPVPGGKYLAEARKIVDNHIFKFERSVARHGGEIDLTNLPDKLPTRGDELAEPRMIELPTQEENISLFSTSPQTKGTSPSTNLLDSIMVADDVEPPFTSQSAQPEIKDRQQKETNPQWAEKQRIAARKQAAQETLKNAEYLPGAFLSKESLELKLAAHKPHSEYDFLAESFVQELRKSKFVLVYADGTSEFMSAGKLSDPSVNWDESSDTLKGYEQEAIAKLVNFCSVNDNQNTAPPSAYSTDSQFKAPQSMASFTTKDDFNPALISATRISMVANKDGIDFGNAFRENMHRSQALQLPGYGTTVHGLSRKTPQGMFTQAYGEPGSTDFPDSTPSPTAPTAQEFDKEQNLADVNKQIADVKRQSDNCYVIKADGNGRYSVTLHSDTPLVGLQQTTYRKTEEDILESKKELVHPINSSFSHWNTTTSASIDRDLNVTLQNFKYDYKAALYVSPVDDLNNSPQLPHQKTMQNWSNKLSVPQISSILLTQEDYLQAQDFAQEEFTGLSQGPNYQSRIAAHLDNPNLSVQDKAALKETHDFLKKSILSLAQSGNIEDENQEKVSEQYEAILEMTRAKQAELAKLASMDYYTHTLPDSEGVVPPAVPETPGTKEARVKSCSELLQLGALLASQLEEFVAVYQSATSDFMDGDLVVPANQFNASKIEFSRMQSYAVNQTINQIISRYQTTVENDKQANSAAPAPELQAHSQPAETRQLVNANRDIGINNMDLQALQASMMERHLSHSKYAADALAGYSAHGRFGAGISKKEFKALAKEVAKGHTIIDQLPIANPDLSEVQLVKLKIEDMIRRNPALKSEFADFDQLYKENYRVMLKNQNWAPIENSYFDHIITKTGDSINNTGQMERKSVITPASNFSDEIFAATYNGKGVPCSERMQAKHVNNLALTQQFDGQGKILYSGLRHGILDAYDLRPKALASASVTVKNTLIHDINSFAGEGTVNHDNFTSKEGIAQLRKLAGESMAQELVRAAVVTNPRMLEKIENGQPVHLTLDSVSLVTPDILRALKRTGKSERTLLTNQIAALDSLKDANGEPKEIKFKVMINNQEIEATVTTEVNKFNISVNKYAVAEGFRSLLKCFMNWQRSDGISKPSLEKLVGNITRRNRAVVGGEAGQVINYLLGKDHGGLSEERRADIDAHFENLPFASKADYAEAIRKEALEIKDIFRRKIHHKAGNEPYKLAVRIPMLSYLLGHTPAVNCKSGKDRTGMNDAMVKYHSSSVAVNHHPQPDTIPDTVRITNFTLNSGNLELQQYNTGLQGYKLLGVPALFRNLQSSLAKTLFLGDSRKVKG